MPRIVSPSAAESFLFAAQGLFDGAEALEAPSSRQPLACAFLSAQALECTLKAFLSHSGMDQRQLKSIGHNLEKLWTQAASAGLVVSEHPPHWCSMLNSAHDKPYYYRYPMGLNGMVFPPLGSVISGLKNVLIQVNTVVRGEA
ncbi:hypothetical protein [Denitromonas halophila]|uniref:HEPN domain-containing protein n=1 Tax=Denitromonas halophila TaxID=1629404 RepID=A0A557QFG8_9RHOO|nr:hypothetical protein [Denitromonas halophila]TVO51649.1 hypothetical protein FHP91_19510 [Denitromonas halophila]